MSSEMDLYRELCRGSGSQSVAYGFFQSSHSLIIRDQRPISNLHQNIYGALYTSSSHPTRQQTAVSLRAFQRESNRSRPSSLSTMALNTDREEELQCLGVRNSDAGDERLKAFCVQAEYLKALHALQQAGSASVRLHCFSKS